MSSNSGSSSRVSIPNSARRLIQNIKEFAGNHSDEDVYAMLKECSMDPNETAQRLLFLDTFHEVKRKRDKKKENINSRSFEEPRRKPGNQGRGARIGRGGYSNQYTTHDTGGGKNVSVRKENGLEDTREKDLRTTPAQPVSKEVDVKEPPSLSKESLVTENGSVKVPADGPSEKIPEAVPIQREDKSLQLSAEASASAVTEREFVVSLEPLSQTKDNQSLLADKVELTEVPVEPVISDEKFQLTADPVPELSSTVKSNLLHTIGPSKAEGDTKSKLDMLRSSDVQHVIIPNHIQVPDAIKCVLSFGTLDINCGVKATKVDSDESNQNTNNASESLEPEVTKEDSSCEQDPLPTSQEDESSSIPPQAPLHPQETTESKIAVPKEDQMKQDALSAAGPPYPVVQPPSHYNFGLVPPVLGSTVVPIEGLEHQARLSSSVSGNSLPMPSPTPTPPPTQSVGPGQSSIAVSAQPLPLFRQAYPPNYFPYNPYFPHIYMPPPTLHQFFGPGGYPQQLQASNMYMPPPPPPGAAQVGMKVPPSHFKGTGPTPNQPNQVPPVGLPSPGYGVLGSAQVGYGHSGAVTSGSSNANEDLMASALKENNMYLGQQSEGSPMWIPVPGRESANIPINSFFNLPLPPQGQHTIAPPQPGLGAYPYYHHPLQALAAASPTSAGAHPLMHQQSPQSLAGPPQLQAESVVGPSPPPPPSNGYQQQAQQPQRQPINWNNGF